MTTLPLRKYLHVLLSLAVALTVVAVPIGTPARAEITGRAVAIAADPLGPGYWILMADGRVIPRGSADGTAPAFSSTATGLAAHPTGNGFWRAKGNALVRGFGAATVDADPQPNRDSRVVGVAPHYGGQGLWRVTKRGQVLGKNVTRYGRVPTDEPVKGVAGHPEASGYWVVNRRGKIFGFGASQVLGTRAGDGATGIAAHPSGDGYWVAKANGDVVAYGVSGHHGNASIDVPIVDIAAAPDGGGYWLLARDGRVRAFGSAREGMISTSGPPQPELETVGGITVNTTIATNVRRLLRAAAADGIRYGGGGYRSYDVQVRLRAQNCGVRYYDVFVKSSGECSPMTAIPGRSMHERGLAIDFYRKHPDGSISAIAGTRAFRWLDRHAHKYGLYNLPSEPWHWSTTGG